MGVLGGTADADATVADSSKTITDNASPTCTCS